MQGTLTLYQQPQDIPITVTPWGVLPSTLKPSCASGAAQLQQKEEMMFPASLQVATKVLTPSGPAQWGMDPPPTVFSIKTLIFKSSSEQNAFRREGREIPGTNSS